MSAATLLTSACKRASNIADASRSASACQSLRIDCCCWSSAFLRLSCCRMAASRVSSTSRAVSYCRALSWCLASASATAATSSAGSIAAGIVAGIAAGTAAGIACAGDTRGGVDGAGSSTIATTSSFSASAAGTAECTATVHFLRIYSRTNAANRCSISTALGCKAEPLLWF